MGAESRWIVKVLRTVEDEIECYGVVQSEAAEHAEKQRGVIKVLSVRYPDDRGPEWTP